MTEQKGIITGKKLPISLKVAAGYLVFYGVVVLSDPPKQGQGVRLR
jgi:hypothetical protein